MSRTSPNERSTPPISWTKIAGMAAKVHLHMTKEFSKQVTNKHLTPSTSHADYGGISRTVETFPHNALLRSTRRAHALGAHRPIGRPFLRLRFRRSWDRDHVGGQDDDHIKNVGSFTPPAPALKLPESIDRPIATDAITPSPGNQRVYRSTCSAQWGKPPTSDCK